LSDLKFFYPIAAEEDEVVVVVVVVGLTFSSTCPKEPFRVQIEKNGLLYLPGVSVPDLELRFPCLFANVHGIVQLLQSLCFPQSNISRYSCEKTS
jgi:hypothetical protein